MKTKLILFALLTFLFSNLGNSSPYLSVLSIDVQEAPNKTYVIYLADGRSFETDKDILIRNITPGINEIQIFKRKYSNSGSNFKEKLVYSGSIHLPKRSKVITQLFQRNLIVKRIIKKKRPNKIGMRPDIFFQLKQTVLEENFDKDRLRTLVFACKRSPISSAQVLELMSLLSFESNKLSFAKKAYQNTIDKSNYFIVRRGLTYTSSKRKLTKHINSCKPPHKKKKHDRRR